MSIQNRSMPNGKFSGVAEGIKELQDRAVPTCNEFYRLEKELITNFDFKSLWELHNIFIDKSYIDKLKTLSDDLQIFYEQLKTFNNNVVLLSGKIFEDTLFSIQICDLNSLTIHAMRMSLFGSETKTFFANSIQVASSSIQNTIDLNMLPKESALEIFKAYRANINDSPMNNKALALAQIQILSDRNTQKSSKGNLSFFSNVYNQMKAIGFNPIRKNRMKSGKSNQNLLKHIQKQSTDEDIIRRNVIVKIDVNNNWILLEKVLRYSMMREIPVVVVFNLRLDGERSQKLEDFLNDWKMPFSRLFANVNDTENSNLLIFYMPQPYLNFQLTRSQRYQPRLNEKNNFMMADVDFNNSRFQLITIYGSKMSKENEQRLYLRLNRLISNTPTLLIVQSTNGRFHTTCADGDLVLELANEDLLNQLEDTDGTLIYISKEFPEDIRNIRVFTGQMKYRRSKHQAAANLEASIVVTSMPLNQ